MYNCYERDCDIMNIVIFIIILVFLILTVLGVLVINIYNKLTFYKKKVLNKFNDINDCLNETVNIIKEIISIIKDDKFHEDSLVLELNMLMGKIENENSINGLLLLIDESYQTISRSLSINNIYEELNNNSEFISVRDKFDNNHYKIMYAIEIYNEEVEEYNNYKNKKINNIIAKKFKFEDYNYYKK